MPSTTHSELIEVLREAREFLARPGNDFDWSSWNSRDDALRQIDGLIAGIESDDMPARIDLTLLFAPTGNIQEVAESSGGGRQFLTLAARFDAAIEGV
jgi:hypothetical protein